MLQFFKKQRLHTQNCFQKEYILYKFQIKMYLESFVSIYHLYHLFAIIYKIMFYNLNITLNYCFISKTINIKGHFSWKCSLGPWYPNVWQSSSFFSDNNISNQFVYFRTQMLLSCSNSLVHLPFLHRYYSWLYIIKWGNHEAI